ncbi:hypothetical protein QD47_26225 [Paenibacillus terrae]|uniref:Uncharacterized protein n=1 Tax=Paenibacillus terrae TaxID=159743 RepID=A0A0D7WYH5_9BACL|nr:hypothetical protein QD47_26225 [Paenibacillus terrae]
MNQIEIYKKIRTWENIRKFEIKDRTHKIKGTKPEPEIWELNIFSGEPYYEGWPFKQFLPDSKKSKMHSSNWVLTSSMW